MGMIERRGGVIAGEQAGGALVAIPLQEMTDGPRWEIVELGQGGDGFPPGRSLAEFLTDRNGDRLGHRGRLRVGAVKIKNVHPFQHVTRPLAKPRERINPAKPTERRHLPCRFSGMVVVDASSDLETTAGQALPYQDKPESVTAPGFVAIPRDGSHKE
jgi:hypothetical protein